MSFKPDVLPCQLYSQKGLDVVLQNSINLERTPFGQDIQLTLRYVPDRELVEDAPLCQWLEKHLQVEDIPPANLVATLCNAFYDAAIPQYVDISLVYNTDDHQEHFHQATKHQPEYELPEQLKRLMF